MSIICIRENFNEFELNSGQCEWEPACFAEGQCPLKVITDEYYEERLPYLPNDYDAKTIYCHAIGTDMECPDCLNTSCYEPCLLTPDYEYED